MDFIKDIYHFALAFFGNIIYFAPSKNIFVIGVTGTKGKSTVVELISSILEAAGKKTAFISSVQVKIGDERYPNTSGNSMPGRLFIQKFLREAVRARCTYAILEVTSQGILQHRHRFIQFDAAMFLNIHPEHIESHGSFERYRDAKVKFFSDVAAHSRKQRKSFFINHADPSREYFFNAVSNMGEVYYFSREHFLETRLAHKKTMVSPWLQSDFNLENASAAAKLAETIGIDWATVRSALASFKGVPGRMDTVQEKPFAVIVDYAHTPDSLRAVYNAVKPATPKKLICVLGSAGGGRDTWKRPEFGRIASEYCSITIVTNEDPYDESPLAIIQEVASGFVVDKKKKHTLHTIEDRGDAIRMALHEAKRGDVVIVTGKGIEPWIHAERGRKIPWSDRAVIEESLIPNKSSV